MTILQLLFWFIAYSTGIAGLSLAAAAYLRTRTADGKNLFNLLLSFSALVIPAMLINLFEASGFLWSMRQVNFDFLITSFTVAGFWGAIFLTRSFLLRVVPEKGKKSVGRISLILAVSISAAVYLYMAVPAVFFGLLSVGLTGAVLILLPCSAMYSVIAALVKKQSPVHVSAGIVIIAFSLFYSKILPVESFFIFPAFYIGFNGVFISSMFTSLTALPSREPDQDKMGNLGISPREGEVVRLLLLGHSYKEIGEKLYISLPTVQTHVSRIYQKAGVNSKMELLQLFSM